MEPYTVFSLIILWFYNHQYLVNNNSWNSINEFYNSPNKMKNSRELTLHIFFLLHWSFKFALETKGHMWTNLGGMTVWLIASWHLYIPCYGWNSFKMFMPSMNVTVKECSTKKFICSFAFIFTNSRTKNKIIYHYIYRGQYSLI